MTTIIAEMLNSKVLVPLTTETGFVSRMFLVPKGNGSLRPIFNLQRLNEYLTPKKFRLISHFKVPSFLQRNDFLIKIDLTQAYFHVPIKPTHQRFLAISYQESLYCMTCLPFGLASAPQAFASLSNWTAGILRDLGMRVIVYLDDFLLAHQDPVVLESQGNQAISTLKSLGWTINVEKSQLKPTSTLQFLGIMWNPHQDQKYLPLDKVEVISVVLSTLLTNGCWCWQDAKSLLGYLSFASFVIPYGRLHCRAIQRKMRWLPQESPHRYFRLPVKVREEINWWKSALSERSEIFPKPVGVFITTDASDSGWGVQLNDSVQGGVWMEDQSNWHINRKEMFAVQ
ncbi:Retrotransposon protein [Nesidiocoris tenuis]|uniref:Retrotransposon protein n=1 Tax=Nesidiocoris tenuis TaxID=355587 RepID=A0ABN7BCC1_9HEMI|nr:Retrotransposon protein [Nesidiocoris tenuis]